MVPAAGTLAHFFKPDRVSTVEQHRPVAAALAPLPRQRRLDTAQASFFWRERRHPGAMMSYSFLISLRCCTQPLKFPQKCVSRSSSMRVLFK